MFIKLTIKESDTVLVNTDSIEYIYRQHGTSGICFSGEGCLTVKETLDEIELKIKLGSR